MPELHLHGPHQGFTSTYTDLPSDLHLNTQTRWPAKQLEAAIKYVPLKRVHNVNSLASTITPNKVSEKRQ